VDSFLYYLDDKEINVRGLHVAIIQEIWLLNRGGIILFNLRLDERPMRQDLLGGFLAAISNLSKELDKSKASSVLLGSTRLSLLDIEKQDLMVAARSDVDTKEKKVNEVLLKLRQRLVEYMSHIGPVQTAREKINTIGTSFQFDEGLTNIFLDME